MDYRRQNEHTRTTDQSPGTEYFPHVVRRRRRIHKTEAPRYLELHGTFGESSVQEGAFHLDCILSLGNWVGQVASPWRAGPTNDTTRQRHYAPWTHTTSRQNHSFENKHSTWNASCLVRCE